MPRDGELKIPDETFRNRNAEPDSSTAANPLRTNAAIPGTARPMVPAPRGVRPVERHFFSGSSFSPRSLPRGRPTAAPQGAVPPSAGGGLRPSISMIYIAAR